MAKENPFENIEKSIAELQRNWENVVIRYVSIETHGGRCYDGADPKELFREFVSIHGNGIIVINLPDWNFDWACSIIALAFDRDTCGLDKQLAIYKHNLAHPDKDVAWKIYIAKKLYKQNEGTASEDRNSSNNFRKR